MTSAPTPPGGPLRAPVWPQSCITFRSTSPPCVLKTAMGWAMRPLVEGTPYTFSITLSARYTPVKVVFPVGKKALPNAASVAEPHTTRPLRWTPLTVHPVTFTSANPTTVPVFWIGVRTRMPSCVPVTLQLLMYTLRHLLPDVTL